MLSSMTGYGRSDKQTDHLNLSVEIRTVNSRFLDFSPRMPRALQPYEDDAYKLVKKSCVRGRISVSVKLTYLPGSKNALALNNNKLKEYLMVIDAIHMNTDLNDYPTVGEILKLPDILENEEMDNTGDLKNIFLSVLEKALIETKNIRDDEGANIQQDIEKRLVLLDKIIQRIQITSKSMRKEYFDNYKRKIQELIADISVDDNRLCQEIAVLSEKRDITEELVRFLSHIELFSKYMLSDVNEGKKLTFLLQEMGREVNTIGSKTDSIEISHLVVDLKDELEKIREQAQNII